MKGMLDKFVLTIVQMNLGASVVILLLFAFQTATRKFKVPRKYYYLLWVAAFLHLVIPFGLIGDRLFFSAETGASFAKEDEGASWEGNAGEENWNMLMDLDASGAKTKSEEKKTVRLAKQDGIEFVALPMIYIEKRVLLLVQILYFSGLLLMAVQRSAEYVRLRRKLAKSVTGKSGICRMAQVTEPFSIGFLHPRIYLPEELSSEQFESVLSHEELHIRRGDLIVKGIAMACSVLHWFNPLLKPAYARMTLEMEMACDESVLDRFGEEKRKLYIKSLIELSTEKKEGGNDMMVGYNTGETKKRIMNAIAYQKAGIMKRIFSRLLCLGLIAVAIGISFCAPTCVKAHADEEDVRVDQPLPAGWRVEGEEITTSAAAALEEQWRQEGMQLIDQQVDIMPPSSRDGVSYETRTHTYYFSIFIGDLMKLRATCTYTVYYYTDGKVHLYSRGISLYTASDFSDSYVTYGSIVNTDGSYSGTTGDKVTAIQGSTQRVFALYFSVDSTNGPDFVYHEYTGQ